MADLTLTLTEAEALHLTIAANLELRRGNPHHPGAVALRNAIAKLKPPRPPKRIFLVVEAAGAVFTMERDMLHSAPIMAEDGTFSRNIDDYCEVDPDDCTPEDKRMHHLVRAALISLHLNLTLAAEVPHGS